MTKYVYNAAGLLSVQIAIDANANGGTTPQYQDTHNVYAMDLADNSVGAGSPVFDGSLLRATIYPDSTDITDYALLLSSGDNGDFVQTTYNADGTVATRTDQNGTTHTYTYDDLDRLTGEPHLVCNCSADKDWAMQGEQAWPRAKIETDGLKHSGGVSFESTLAAG